MSQKRSSIVFDRSPKYATGTAWKVSLFGVFCSVFFRIWTEYGPEKLQIRTLLTQCRLLGFSGIRWCNLCCTNLLWSWNGDMDFSSQRTRTQNKIKLNVSQCSILIMKYKNDRRMTATCRKSRHWKIYWDFLWGKYVETKSLLKMTTT